MKEKIYTIPVTESYEQDTECPFCFLEKRLEKEAIEYALGSAMMEPDFRVESNKKGYCTKHFSMMLKMPNKLSLALVLDTHLNEQLKALESAAESIKEEKRKFGVFKKREIAESDLYSLSSSCVVCDRVNATMERYIEVFFYMWEKDENFRKKVLASKGFCLRHFSDIAKNCDKYLKSPAMFLKEMFTIETENLKRINDDVHKFTLKFDYRNKDMPLGTAKDAPKNAIEKLGGFIENE